MGFPWEAAAPEVLESHGRVHNIKSDVWSFGILIWEIFSLGFVPWAGHKFSAEFLELLKARGIIPQRPCRCSEQMYALMCECWKWKPEERPEFGHVANVLESIYMEMCLAVTGSSSNTELIDETQSEPSVADP